MRTISPGLTRRSILLAAGATVLKCSAGSAAEGPVVTVHRDPTCGCCSGWVRHLQNAGYATNVLETSDIDAVKRKLGVPSELTACHTAEVAGYVIEGHVPAVALRRLLSDKPSAKGLAVRGMPVGSPGMEGGTPEPYDVVMFGPTGQRTYMRFVGEQPV